MTSAKDAVGALRDEVCRANIELWRRGLATFTFGNASAIDRSHGLIVIKPSGVPYADLRPEMLVVTDLDGRVVEGKLRPSSDLLTHVVLYRAFAQIGGVVHTHSHYAAVWAQSRREIPCLGTTHADYFHGPVPITTHLEGAEIRADYEENTGHAIVRRFARLDPIMVSARAGVPSGSNGSPRRPSRTAKAASIESDRSGGGKRSLPRARPNLRA